MGCWGTRLLLAGLVAGCSTENPAFVPMRASDGANSTGRDDDPLDDDGAEDDETTNSGEDDTNLEQGCSDVPRREFEVEIGEIDCDAPTAINWVCGSLTRTKRGAWELVACCDVVLVDGGGCPSDRLDVRPISFGAVELRNELAPAENITVRGNLVEHDNSCRASWIEITTIGRILPLFAGSRVLEPELMTLVVSQLPPENGDSCACDEPDCCDQRPGSWRLGFAPKIANGVFPGVQLSEGEIFNEQVGDFGIPFIRNYVSHRAPACGAPLRVDWVFALPAP
ncbi:MAG: hypothetical protein JKY37_29440 [Nannocystaceae bacterium]|nr:hypothetical protein [Nannocystaceae bacterium]